MRHGQKDVDVLTPHGRDQVSTNAGRMIRTMYPLMTSGNVFPIIFHSPVARCAQSAEIARDVLTQQLGMRFELRAVENLGVGGLPEGANAAYQKAETALGKNASVNQWYQQPGWHYWQHLLRVCGLLAIGEIVTAHGAVLDGQVVVGLSHSGIAEFLSDRERMAEHGLLGEAEIIQYLVGFDEDKMSFTPSLRLPCSLV